MSETTAPPTALPDKGLVARFIGVITSPRETYAAVAAFPRWLGMAIVVILIVGACQMWFQSTAVGRQATLDEAIRRTESFGMKVSDQMYEQIRKSIMEPPAWRTGLTAATMVVGPPIMWAILAGALFLVFGVFTGGRATFKQVFAVVVHSSVISTIGTLFLTPLNYFRQSLSSATNLGVFLPFLPEGSFLARLAGMADLLLIWWLTSLAIGVAVTYKKKTGSVAMVLFGVYAVIAIGIAAIMAARS
ncbi:MAG TPA: YIP1 family protein [Vicinamibacterales bacterium]